jgi:trimeric autotransporter adhesin
MSIKKSAQSFYLALLILGIFNSTATAQTIIPKDTKTVNSSQTPRQNNQAQLLAQTEEAGARTDVITFQPRVGASYTTEGAGFKPYGSFEGFFPLFQNPGENLTFVEGKMLLDTDSGALGGNLLLGHRFLNSGKNRVIGTYLSYDTRNTGNAVFNQLGLGLESLGENWDFHFNGYLPLGQSSAQLGSDRYPGTSTFQGTSLQLDRVRLFQDSLSGIDAEVGTKLASWTNGGLRGYAGAYVYGGANTGTFVGARSRVVGTWDGLVAGFSLQTDSQFDTRLVFNIGASLGSVKTGENQSILARMGEPVQRESSILVNNQIVKDSVTAKSSTGKDLVFRPITLGANTSLLTNTLTAAKPGDIVYVQGGTNPGVGEISIPNDVQLLSNGPVQLINTSLGNFQLPGSGTGVNPTVTGTVTLASNGSNQTLSGFAITNTSGQPGIVGQNNTNATIANNQVTINAPNTSNILAGRGIVLIGANGLTTIDKNTVTNAIGEGIRLDNVSGKASITSNTVTNTIQPITSSGLESSIFIRNNRGDVDLTIARNIVGDNKTGTNIEIDGIEFGLCRSYSTLDTFAKCSGTATAKVNIVDNIVRNIGNSRNGADGIDINLNNNDDTTDAGARVSNLTISRNQIFNISDKGVSFGVDGDAILGLGTISNNTVENVGDNGLHLRSRRNSNSNFVASSNSIKNAGANGISYSLNRSDASPNTNNAVSSAIISNNTIADSGSNGIGIDIRDLGQATATVSNNTITNTRTTGATRGIDAQTRESGRLNLILDTNAISGSRADGIRIQAGTNAGTSVANISVRNNNLQGNNTAPTANSGGLSASSANNSNLCLQVQNNIAGTSANTGFIFSRTAPSTFRIESTLLTTNAGTFTPTLPLNTASYTSVPSGTCGFP